ncbi:MAG: hypothetical protein E4G99_10260 [Anaerolineales bacterium]|nr:MAG: hypothetical protein E4G99_10260 [Anaerolineales bacterium]
MTQEPEVKVVTIAETASYIAWSAIEPDVEKTYHVELGTVTLHFFQEEWDEFIELVAKIKGS